MKTLDDNPRTFACRHCTATNRVKPSVASMKLGKIHCGSCSQPLFLNHDENLTGLSSSSYEHPFDRKALAMLRKIPGTNTLLKFIVGELSDRRLHMLFQQNSVKVQPHHIPNLYRHLEYAAGVLDMDAIPDLFITQDAYPNAFAIGVDEPFIVVTTALLDLLDENQILGVLGHELGHIQAGHQLYRTALYLLIEVADKAMGNLIPFRGAALLAIYHGLMYWNRCSELSADRAGMLVQRHFDSFVKCEMKFAGGCQYTDGQLSTEAFLEQAREATQMQEDNWLNRMYAGLQISNATHPFPVWRAGHMHQWVLEGNYLDIMAGNYERRDVSTVSDVVLPEENDRLPGPVADLISGLRGFLKRD